MILITTKLMKVQEVFDELDPQEVAILRARGCMVQGTGWRLQHARCNAGCRMREGWTGAEGRTWRVTGRVAGGLVWPSELESGRVDGQAVVWAGA